MDLAQPEQRWVFWLLQCLLRFSNIMIITKNFKFRMSKDDQGAWRHVTKSYSMRRLGLARRKLLTTTVVYIIQRCVTWLRTKISKCSMRSSFNLRQWISTTVWPVNRLLNAHDHGKTCVDLVLPLTVSRFQLQTMLVLGGFRLTYEQLQIENSTRLKRKPRTLTWTGNGRATVLNKD